MKIWVGEIYLEKHGIKMKHKESALTHKDLVLGKLQLLHSDHLFPIHCCLQGCLVDQVLQFSPRKSHCAPGNDLRISSCETTDQVFCQENLCVQRTISLFFPLINVLTGV